ncbi:coil containing protein [Vibrio phage 1.003.O._10N.286.48.A2]|nr:coil containing protein [Vibrio phage 1.003.O._10N.286.48.A2]
MKHVYKLGGERKTKDGTEYTIEAVDDNKFHLYLANGWVSDIGDLNCIEAEYEVVAESGSDHEAELREQIKALGGKPAGRSSIETLEKQLKELQNGSDS